MQVEVSNLPKGTPAIRQTAAIAPAEAPQIFLNFMLGK